MSKKEWTQNEQFLLRFQRFKCHMIETHWYQHIYFDSILCQTLLLFLFWVIEIKPKCKHTKDWTKYRPNLDKIWFLQSNRYKILFNHHKMIPDLLFFVVILILTGSLLFLLVYFVCVKLCAGKKLQSNKIHFFFRR